MRQCFLKQIGYSATETLEIAKYGMISDTKVLGCEFKNLNSEHRYYVLEGKILGHARYDSGPDEWPDPDQEQVEKMVEILSNITNTPVAYALDVGVLDNGSTALVEFNDAWAIGLYRGAISAEQYALFLQHRWNQLFKEKP